MLPLKKTVFGEEDVGVELLLSPVKVDLFKVVPRYSPNPAMTMIAITKRLPATSEIAFLVLANSKH